MIRNNRVKGIFLLLIVILLLNVNKLSIKGGDNIDWNTGYPKRKNKVTNVDYLEGNKIWMDKVFWSVFIFFIFYITIIFITVMTEETESKIGIVENLENLENLENDPNVGKNSPNSIPTHLSQRISPSSSPYKYDD